MVRRNIGTLLERQTVGTVSSIEHTIEQYAVDIEVGLHLVLRDVEQLLLHLSGIVEVVVGLEVEVSDGETVGHMLAGKVLDGLCLGISLGHIGLNQVRQEIVDIHWGLGHRILQRIRGIIRIAHDLGLLGTQLGNLDNQWEGIVLACSIGTMDRGFVNLLAQLTVIEAG